MSRSFLRSVLLPLGSWFLAAALVSAQDAAPAGAMGPASAPQAKVDMTIQQAVALAIAKNFDIQIQEYSVLTSKESVAIAKADYDPSLQASTTHNLTQQANASTTLEGSSAPRTEGAAGSITVSQKVSTGANVSLSANLFNRSSSNQSINTFNPQYNSGLALSVTQPLLRGFGRTYNLANIKIALIGLDMANLSYKGRVLDVIQSVENAYASLVSSRESLDVLQFSLKLAQTSDDETKARKNAGLLTDLDVYSSEYNVVSSRNNVLKAEQDIRNKEDALRQLLGGDNYDVAITPVTGIPPYNQPAPTVELSYRLALQNQTDYQRQLAAIKQNELSVVVAKSNRLPSLGLTGGLGYTGRDQGFDQAWDRVRERDSYNWNFGLSLNMPWGLHADNARYRTSLYNLTTAQIQLRQLEQSLLVQVRSAVRTVEFNIESVRLTALASQLSQKKYDFEKARYDVGQTTARDLLQAQSDLESARLGELQAKVSLNTALSALQRLEGLTLDTYHITVPTEKAP
ncbi:MAG TPA: TolC family protein [Opitutaceae bacterium]|nr:TolC family protein [Opitutaceae bacterium]